MDLSASVDTALHELVGAVDDKVGSSNIRPSCRKSHPADGFLFEAKLQALGPTKASLESLRAGFRLRALPLIALFVLPDEGAVQSAETPEWG